eukprot:INCI13466.8.p1 GENE.INCI13466.8~~INCI13466.8.p1  ORF type:complete len:132 (-),score=19.95 INCI13466.8:150-545(-)
MISTVVVAAGAVLAASRGSPIPNVFGGAYSDPNHPGCARNVTVFGLQGRVYGADAKGGEGVACDGKTDVQWGPLEATIKQDGSALQIVVDFSPKGGPSDLTGTWDAKDAAIQWADGNNWTKTKLSTPYVKK